MASSAFLDGDSVSKPDSDCKVSWLFNNVEESEVSLTLFIMSLMVKLMLEANFVPVGYLYRQKSTAILWSTFRDEFLGVQLNSFLIGGDETASRSLGENFWPTSTNDYALGLYHRMPDVIYGGCSLAWYLQSSWLLFKSGMKSTCPLRCLSASFNSLPVT